MQKNVAHSLAFGCAALLGAGLLFATPAARSQTPAPTTNEPLALPSSEPPAPDPFRAKGLFEVRNYGAAGNGTTDDTDALQRTIDAAQRVHGIAVLDPPSNGFGGRYFVSHTLDVTTSVAVMGLSGTTAIVVKRLDFDVFRIRGRNVEVGHFSVLGDRAAEGAGGNAFHVMQSQNISIHDVAVVGLWSGTLNESSGNVGLRRVAFVAADRQPDPGHPRFGLKATATLPGNSNLTSAVNCIVTNPGRNHGTVDGFVLAHGYNTLGVTDSGVLQGNRAYWTTADGGRPPNFLGLENVAADHDQVGIELDEGAVAQISSSLVTSSPVASLRIASTYLGGPISMVNNQVISTAEGIDLEGGRDITISGGHVSNIGRGDGIRIGSNGAVTISGVSISRIHQGSGLHVLSSHGDGWVTVTGISARQAAYGILVDPGTAGGYTIANNTFGENRLGATRDGGTNPRRIMQPNASY